MEPIAKKTKVEETFSAESIEHQVSLPAPDNQLHSQDISDMLSAKGIKYLHWFRNDLRIRDNPGLSASSERSRLARSQLLTCFLYSPVQWKKHDMADIQLDFISKNLKILQAELSQLNIPLVIINAPEFSDAPNTLLEFMKKYNCESLTFNEEYGINERRRDDKVIAKLSQHGLKAEKLSDQCILPAGTLRSGQGTPYSVFTPYKKQWLKTIPKKVHLEPVPTKQEAADWESFFKDGPSFIMDKFPDTSPGFGNVSSDAYAPGEDAALEKLDAFLNRKVSRYDKTRDFPAQNGTSRLSPYLAIGVLSGRQCYQAAEKYRPKCFGTTDGLDTWINELIWRDFYIHALYDFPRLSMSKSFKLETEGLVWRNSEEDFQAWCDGRTGIPIVDAAMRQLNQTGWMHNRLRMVVAMFLTKNLLIDWRRGEKYFMTKLIDGYLASNNGGWQWSASTGCDPAPYFRMFNPVSQSEKFDPSGEFIRKYIPELANLPDNQIHAPPAGALAKSKYPAPIVDLKSSRERAIQAFKDLRSSNKEGY